MVSVNIKLEAPGYRAPLGFVDVLFYHRCLDDTPEKPAQTLLNIWTTNDKGEIKQTIDLEPGFYRFTVVVLSRDYSMMKQIINNTEEITFNINVTLDVPPL